jgi:hypothetical protein
MFCFLKPIWFPFNVPGTLPRFKLNFWIWFCLKDLVLAITAFFFFFFKTLGPIHQNNASGTVCAIRFEDQFLRNSSALRVFVAWPSYEEDKLKLRCLLRIHSFLWFKVSAYGREETSLQTKGSGWVILSADLASPELNYPWNK